MSKHLPDKIFQGQTILISKQDIEFYPVKGLFFTFLFFGGGGEREREREQTVKIAGERG